MKAGPKIVDLSTLGFMKSKSNKWKRPNRYHLFPREPKHRKVEKNNTRISTTTAGCENSKQYNKLVISLILFMMSTY